MNFDINNFQWTRAPEQFTVSDDKVEIITQPGTDLWQRTYYHFRNDNAPVFQMETEEKFFSFVVKTDFESSHRYDQCGVVMYLDSDNWIKGSIEYETETFQHLGSVVTNNGYSDWATTEIGADIKSMWYRFSRREDDYCIECSRDGEHFQQMRICHMWQGGGKIRFGIYACSPENSSFKATFTNMALTECRWLAHVWSAMVGKYKVITLCGSTRFKDAFYEAQKKLTLEGNIVISVGLFGHSGDKEVWEGMSEDTLTQTKIMLDDMHKRKIDMADEIFVINVGGYIGSSTRSEIDYAIRTGKQVRYLEP